MADQDAIGRMLFGPQPVPAPAPPPPPSIAAVPQPGGIARFATPSEVASLPIGERSASLAEQRVAVAPPSAPAAPPVATIPQQAQQPMSPEEQILARDREIRIRQALAAQQGSPGYLQKGGDILTGYTVSHGADSPTEEDAAKLGQYGESRKEAGEALTLAKMQAFDSEVGIKEKEAEQAVQRYQEVSARAKMVEDETTRRLSEADRLRAEAAQQVMQTPSEFWESRGSGAKALASIAIFLDTMGANLQDKEGTLADRLIRQVNDEVAAQRERRQMLGLEADRVLNSADAYARLFGSPEAQDAAKRQLGLESAKLQLEAEAARAGVPLNDATLAAELENLRAGIAQEQAAINAATRGSVVEQHAVTQDRYVGGRAPRALTDDERALLGGGGESMAVGEADARGNATRVVTEEGVFFAKDAAQAQKQQEFFDSAGEVQRLSEQIIREVEQGQTLTGDARARAEVNTNQLLLKLKDTAHLGVMSESDKKIVETMSGQGAKELFSRDTATVAGLRQVQQNTQAARRDQMRSLSTAPGRYVPATGGLRTTRPVE